MVGIRRVVILFASQVWVQLLHNPKNISPKGSLCRDQLCKTKVTLRDSCFLPLTQA